MKGVINYGSFVSIAQLTDIHLFADINRSLVGIKTEFSFQEVLKQIKRTLPQIDLLLLTGDLTQDGSIESYERLRQSLDDFGVHAYCLAGNHDDIPLMKAHLPSEYVHLSHSLDVGKWRILLLSSVVVDAVHGYLSGEELSYLENSLNTYPDRPTIIAFHHPAVPLGSQWIDGICLENQDEFWAICDRHPQIEIVLNGHAHQAFDQIYETPHNSVRCLVTPSTCIQFEPQNDKFQIDSQPPGFRHLCLYPNSTMETEVHRLKVGSFHPDLAAVGY
ncbi:3',5'-cyclic-AMP phosphodiesterase [Pseudanabaena yagii]|uniref:3',5'-cyclic-AMP phosphodiesterase n=1 Tax=Pseudanabaena yagii GIHE-NHR1 TaxID=2722753 RepID=A0ABX1LUP6_9CYAN|nr:3',5'-cyclic-AMP phosphodiesterase [Pseudanabaena yagii]NMF59230.1 3',5'-cyclic-AMP phosphodiesterase [Pseudanabaena yagii GIHE-NHR1]